MAGHDAQAQAGARLEPGPLGAVEALQHRLALALRHARAVVDHLDPRPQVRAVRRRRTRRRAA